MREASINVTIERGMFSSERCVTIQGATEKYQALVDVCNLDENLGRMLVYPTEFGGDADTILVDLPCLDTFTSGPRIRVLRSALCPPIDLPPLSR